MEFILAFGSAHKALKAESVLNEFDVPFRLLPAPKALVPFCDLVISVGADALEAALDALEEQGLKPKAIFKKEGEEYAQV
jgi:hypothetical protein